MALPKEIAQAPGTADEHSAAGERRLTAAQARAAIDLALRLGDPAAAEHGARTLLRAFPSATSLAILLGRALLDQGDHAGAIEQFRGALARNPLDSAGWLGLAGALSQAGQGDEARQALQRAALHDPLDSELLTPGVAAPPPESLGVVYLRRGYPALAVAELAATLARAPRRDDLRIYYVEALRRDDDLAGAREQLARLAPSGKPSLPHLLLRAALAAPADTADLLQECSRFDPDWQLTRRFFAPELAPWSLPAAPTLPWSTAFQPLEPYIAPASAAPKSAGVAPAASTHPQSAPAARPPADPEVRSFVATTERLRQRLVVAGGGPRPLVPWTGERRHSQALLGCKATLRRRYGDDGFAAIDRRLRGLAEALRRRGVETYCCYIDDAASLHVDDEIALAPVAPEPEAIRDLVRALGGALAERRHELGTLLLIGGDDSVPLHRLTNPIHDDDAAVLSDTPYGSDDAGHVLPQRIVARLPDGAGGDPGLLLDLLDQMIDYHAGRQPRHGAQRGLLGWRRASAAQPHALHAGYSAEIWRDSSREVLDALDASAPLSSSPPLLADTLAGAEWDGRRLLYVNLHGASGLPNWYGQPDASWPGAATKLPIALRPDQLGNRRLAGGVLVSEACYGLDLEGRTVETSIPLRALAEGALACVGSTVNAYGSISGPLVGADLLCQRLLAHLAAGVPIGEALRQARLELAQTMYRRQGYLDDVDVKTLTEFVLLGDPWAALPATAAAPASWPVSKVAGIERVPKPRPKAVLDEAQVPRDLLRRAREALHRVLPEAALASLHIVAQPSARFVRKGDADQELVVSAQDRRMTADGYQIAQTALVTLSGQAVVKVALTR